LRSQAEDQTELAAANARSDVATEAARGGVTDFSQC
jgi:hypothetical protein